MKFKRGVSFWSYGHSYRAGRLTIEGMLAEISKIGATGVEALPNINNFYPYPNYTQKDTENWFALLEKYHLEPVCHAAMIPCKEILACGADMRGMPYTHFGASYEEMVELMRHEIDLAKAFGFKIMRHPLMSGIDPRAIEENLRYAEDNGIALDLEIHSPNQTTGPEVAWQIDMIERNNAKLAGIIPDLNAFQNRLPAGLRRAVLAEGADPESIAYIDNALEKHMDMPTVAEEIENRTDNAATLRYVRTAKFLNPDNLDNLRPLAKYINHFHTKFFEMDENGRETSFDYPHVLTFLREIGFDGYLMTEYEGQIALGLDGTEEVEQVARQHRMIEKIAAGLK